jgi:CCR4-NOT transcription complex subunit 9
MQMPTRAITDEDTKIYTWIMELVQGDRRETALLELSKKREQVEDLAVILWHSVGARLPHPLTEVQRLTRLWW